MDVFGGGVKKLNKTSIYHPDLNANNILIDNQDEFTFIDFDKAKINPDTNQWDILVVNRLKRSLDKIKGQQIFQQLPFHFSEKDWDSFNQGYHGN